MKKNHVEIIDSGSLIIQQAQQELLSPKCFYRLCRQLFKPKYQTQIYFLLSGKSIESIPHISKINLLRFFDCLAKYIIKIKTIEAAKNFYLQTTLLRLKDRIIKKVIVKNQAHNQYNNYVKIAVKSVGAGMIGRVACIQINQGKLLAFKAFFDPDFVWLHGPWGEIPVGIYLQAHQVTKDIPEFQFASQNWAVWEWIEPETKPENRVGIAYDDFAQQQGLTSLNLLNHHNYNHHQIRLDPGGIQKEYYGRRLENMWQSICFYLRKMHREGILSLAHYLTCKNLNYASKRLLNLLISKKEN